MRGNLALAEELSNHPDREIIEMAQKRLEEARATIRRMAVILDSFGIHVKTEESAGLRFVNKQVETIVEEILAGGKELTFEEIYKEFEAGGGTINIYVPSARLTKALKPMVKNGKVIKRGEKYHLPKK